ncbi:MAG: aquaporin [Armatimonadetes bacterium]|nr:aquaporin [Armatimonadota bacterium]
MMVKRVVGEFIGTFTIVFAPVALSATSAMPNGAAGLYAAAVVSGLAVLAMIYALGPISAAHFNPAVTIGFASAKKFPWKDAPAYILAQIAGAALAAATVALMFGGGHGVHIPATDDALRNILMEVVLTFFLMFVIMAVATDKRVHSAVPAIAIGLTVVFCVLIGGPVTGGSMNPARSLGPALFGGSAALSHIWLYLIAPPLGAVIAARTYEAIRIDEAT